MPVYYWPHIIRVMMLFMLRKVHMGGVGSYDIDAGLIYCWGSPTTISNNVIKNNGITGGYSSDAGHDGDSVTGGVIYCIGQNATIVDNVIMYNGLEGGHGVTFSFGPTAGG